MPLSIQDFLSLLESRLASPEAPSSVIEKLPVSPITRTNSPSFQIPLILGDGRVETRRVGWALEAGEKELTAVEERGLDLLLLWKPLWSSVPGTLRSDAPEPGRAVERLLKARCAVAAVGQALENSALGADCLLASELGLASVRPLRNLLSGPSDRLKLVVFTPVGYENAVIDAMAQGGAGVIGRYSHCTFRTPGVGTYRPLDGAQPWAGAVGRLESAEETRLETVAPREKIVQVLDLVRTVHPYEEMAFDLYPLEELREAPHPFGWMGEAPDKLDAETVRTAGLRCFEATPLPEAPGIPEENRGRESDSSPVGETPQRRMNRIPPLPSRVAICLNGSVVGEAEARRISQSGCGWVVCGNLVESARRVLIEDGIRVVRFSPTSVQEAVFTALWVSPDFRETCAAEEISIARA